MKLALLRRKLKSQALNQPNGSSEGILTKNISSMNVGDIKFQQNLNVLSAFQV
jgi:hypothetical protein